MIAEKGPADGTCTRCDRVEYGMDRRLVALSLGALLTLAGCASSAGGHAGGGHLATLTVHVGIFGGPARPDGEMAASNEPDAGARILVTDRAGSTSSAKTDSDGIATFSLRPGHYTVSGPCTVGARAVDVRSGPAAHVELRCDVP